MSLLVAGGRSEPPSLADSALIVVHGRSLGCKYELRRRQVTIGGGAADDVRLEGLAPCVVRLDRGVAGWTVTRLADTLDVDVDGRSGQRERLESELWIDAAILQLVENRPDVYHDTVFRLSTTDSVSGLATRRWFDELVVRERIRAERGGVPLCMATLRLTGFADLIAGCGPVTAHRLLRAVGILFGTAILDRPVGRVADGTFCALFDGNADARYPFVDALRRAIEGVEVPARVGTVRLDCVATIADVTPKTELFDLEARALASLAAVEAAGERSLVYLP